MNFLEILSQIRAYLAQNGRVSYRMLRRQFDLDDEALEDVKEELIDVQQVAADEGGKVLVWLGVPGDALEPAAGPSPPALERDPAAYTPAHLADRILTRRSALEGERKQVTALFADVKSSMEISAQLGAETWHAILDDFFKILAERVHRYEGTVNQYTGDGIMALFGAPLSHEDHAQRACYAALELRERLAEHAREVKRDHGINFSTRIGLSSGDVVVGKIGDDLRMDYTAQGHTVGLASRMQELASPDTIYLADATVQLVQGYFELEDLGAFPVKGVSEPVRVAELRGVSSLRTRFDVSRSRGLTSFVGRDSDLDMLEAAFQQARAGNGQVVGVVADAGTGKSRLCFEFLEACRARGIRVFQGHCVAHGKNISLLPILQVLRAYFGIDASDSDRFAREKIAGRMLLFDESYREALPLLFDLLCVPDPDNPGSSRSPEERQRTLFGVLRSVVQRPPADDTPVVLIEDLHWIDAASEAWVEEWVDAIHGSSSLLILNFRPEYKAPWMQKSWYRQLPLSPLGEDAIRELIHGLLGDDPSLAGVAETVHSRTGGNPFFAEETVRGLIEAKHLEGERGAYRLVTPVETLEIPATVHSLLSARIDRLVERDKRVLQTASVIGQQFAEPILEAVAELPRLELGEALGVLKAAEFVYEESLYPVAEYAFKHPLTQEVALGSQLRQRRRRTHAAVARAIEEAADPARLNERAALLAHHWDEAGDERQAATWHHRAAEAIGFQHLAEALRHFRRVQHLVDRLPPSDETRREAARVRSQLLWFGLRAGMEREEARQLFEESVRFAEEAGDPGSAAHALFAYGVFELYAGRGPNAYPLLPRSVAEADRSGDLGLRLVTRWGCVLGHYFEGVLAPAIEVATEGIELGAGDPAVGASLMGYTPYHFLLSMRGSLRSLSGDFAGGAADVEAGLQARDLTLAICRAFVAEHGLFTGDAARSLAQARLAVGEIDETSANATAVVFTQRGLGIAHMLNESWGDAVAAFDRSLDRIRQSNTFVQSEPSTLVWKARALVGQGEIARARDTLERALRVGEEQGSRLHRPVEGLVRAMAERAAGAPPETVEASFAEALAAAREIAPGYEPLVHLEMAAWAAERGDAVAHRRALERARDLFTEMGLPARAEAIAHTLA